MTAAEKERKWNGIAARVLVMVMLAVFGVIAVLVVQYRVFQNSGLNVPEEGLVYQLPGGASLSRLSRELHRQAIIDYPRFLAMLGRELGVARQLQAGEYRLLPGMTPKTLLRALASGDVIQHGVTIVEGQTFTEVIQALRESPVITHTLDGLGPDDIMSALGFPGEHPEGRFLPDTYFSPRGTSDREFLRRAHAAMEALLAAEWSKREEGLPLKTPYEALILASIVEKETGLAAERPLIAGVFVRRLQQEMRLQTDPTVIYGVGKDFDGNLRLRNLRNDTPYNTYTRYGLPPTPIAMPGPDAIRATLHPDRSDYLYFVARGNGSHYFSSTLQQHNRAVEKFQKGKTSIKLPEQDQLR